MCTSGCRRPTIWIPTRKGPVFVFLERHELQDILGEHTLDKGTVEFENENYIAYGYPSYDEMRADFFD